MNMIKSEYEEIISQEAEVHKQIQQIEESNMFKEYVALLEKKGNLAARKMSFELALGKKFSSCKHITVCTSVYTLPNGKEKRNLGCIKCGLDESILLEDRRELSLEQTIMFDFLKSDYTYSRLNGIITDIDCDIELGMAMYSKIKEAHKKISDEDVARYFCAALNSIKNIEVNEQRQKSRVKRLGLPSSFRNWNNKNMNHSNQ